jgi:hypothetical protein
LQGILWKNVDKYGFFLWVVLVGLRPTRIGSRGQGNLIVFRWDGGGRRTAGGLKQRFPFGT